MSNILTSSTIANMPPVVHDLLCRLCDLGARVWLLGSQANGTAHVDSDWDLLVFSVEKIMQSLELEEPTPGVDLLVVYDKDKFRSPWSKAENGEFKSGSLSGWKWVETSDLEATYEGTKWPNDWGTQKRAIRLLP